MFVLHNFFLHHSQDSGDDFQYIIPEGVQNAVPDDGQDDVAYNYDVDMRDFRDKIAEMMFRDYQQRVNATERDP